MGLMSLTRTRQSAAVAIKGIVSDCTGIQYSISMDRNCSTPIAEVEGVLLKCRMENGTAISKYFFEKSSVSNRFKQRKKMCSYIGI